LDEGTLGDPKVISIGGISLSFSKPPYSSFFLPLAVMLGLTLACGGKKPRQPASSEIPTTAIPDEDPAPPVAPPQAPPVSEPPDTDRLSRFDEDADILSQTLEDLNAQSPLTDIQFDYDSAALRSQARSTLESHAQWLRRYQSIVVLVEGHCDERGTVEYNLALGERRAMAAYSYLQSLGITIDRLKTISYGKEFPLDPGHTESAWQRNRRGHFVITSK